MVVGELQLASHVNSMSHSDHLRSAIVAYLGIYHPELKAYVIPGSNDDARTGTDLAEKKITDVLVPMGIDYERDDGAYTFHMDRLVLKSGEYYQLPTFGNKPPQQIDKSQHTIESDGVTYQFYSNCDPSQVEKIDETTLRLTFPYSEPIITEDTILGPAVVVPGASGNDVGLYRKKQPKPEPPISPSP